MTGFFMTLLLGTGLAFAESGLGLGVLVPGETAVVILAATMRSPFDMTMLALAVTVGASLGDHLGYFIGRRYGDALRESRVVERVGRHHFDRATELLHRRGASAVFLTRLVPVVRTVTPAAAGAAGVEYRRFALASVAGSATWAAAYVGGGSVLAALSAITSDVFGRASWLLLVVVLLTTVPVLVLRSVLGGRPGTSSPDVATLERLAGSRHRRSSFSPLIGDVQV